MLKESCARTAGSVPWSPGPLLRREQGQGHSGELTMTPLVLIVAIASAWCVLSILAALWLAGVLRDAGRADEVVDRPTPTDDPAARTRALPRT